MEGGFSNHPADRGGATNKGITQQTYDAHRRAVGLGLRSVKHIEDDEVRRIYHARFWMAGKCDAMPWPLSLGHFDACVNHGIGNATKLLQRALGVAQDGKHGPMTQAALEAAQKGALFGEWYAARLRFYYEIVKKKPSQKTFLLGWIARMVHLHEVARSLA